MSIAFVRLFSEVLLKYSEYVSSKKKGVITSPLKTFLTEKLPNYAANYVKSYVSACQEDPELTSFDSSLHLHTSNLIRSFNAGGGKRTEDLSLVCGYLRELSENVAKIIIDSKEDVLKNEELKSLVDLYYESTAKTLNLFNTVEKCVKKAEISMLSIRVVIKQFEKESMDMDLGGNKKKYEGTLEDLHKVKAMGDPFGDDFLEQCTSVCMEQLMLLKKFHEMQVKLDKKQKNVKKRRILATIVFGAAFLSIFVLSMYLCTVVAPPVVATVAIGLTKMVGTAGIWVNEMVKDYQKALESETNLLLLMENSTKINMEAMKTIESLVEKLIISISSILETVEVGVQTRDEEAVKLVMQEIVKKIDGFDEKIEEVGENVGKCSKLVTSGKVRVMEHINSSISH
ncbi:hypothetical protein N665_1629s0003 [Sinapis alba]|nr:hypothetical protein N665_1629s0003 [Sinapis alba]